ncbi:MAG: class A beta-lactamase-related serine hydrolase [Spirochaetia bacterium]|nr:class A beta-lactamase-related serine hydrolase [Spirochaetia bacterium]
MTFDELTNLELARQSFTTSHLRIEKWGTLLYEKMWESGEHIDNPLFDIASITKLFTTTALLRLITIKVLKEETSIKDILPLYPKSIHNIRVKELLTHSSGLIPWYPFYVRKEKSIEEILEEIVEKNPLTPGTVYSDINFILLGKIIESVTNESLQDAFKNLLFIPLQLDETTFHPNTYRCVPTESGNRIEAAMLRDRNLSFHNFRPLDKAIVGECNDGNCYYYFKGVSGHAGLFSNAKDLHKLLHVYNKNNNEYLLPSLVHKALTNQKEKRGYGFQLGDNYPHGGVGHTGFTGTYLYLHPQLGYTISILTNRLHSPHPHDIKPYRNGMVNKALSMFEGISSSSII